MAIGLRPGVAVTASRAAGCVGVPECVQAAGRVRGEPVEERRPEVEARPLVGVDEVAQAPVRIQDAGRRVGGVALGGDARVPVPGRSGGHLGLDHAEPRMLARRLVEMAVQAERAQRTTRPYGLTAWGNGPAGSPRDTTTIPEGSRWSARPSTSPPSGSSRPPGGIRL